MDERHVRLGVRARSEMRTWPRKALESDRLGSHETLSSAGPRRGRGRGWLRPGVLQLAGKSRSSRARCTARGKRRASARWKRNSARTTRFPPYNHQTFRQHQTFGCNRGVLWHRNSDLVVICVRITTHKLCCDIFALCCNRVMLMHPFLGLMLQLVGFTVTPNLSCTSISLLQ